MVVVYACDFEWATHARFDARKLVRFTHTHTYAHSHASVAADADADARWIEVGSRPAPQPTGASKPKPNQSSQAIEPIRCVSRGPVLQQCKRTARTYAFVVCKSEFICLYTLARRPFGAVGFLRGSQLVCPANANVNAGVAVRDVRTHIGTLQCRSGVRFCVFVCVCVRLCLCIVMARTRGRT